MFKRFWHEEAGVLTYEWIMLTTVLVTGVAAGLAEVRDAINSDLAALAQTITALDASLNTSTSGLTSTTSATTGATATSPATSGGAASAWIGRTGGAIQNLPHSLGRIYR
jgi:hypothetical protein